MRGVGVTYWQIGEPSKCHLRFDGWREGERREGMSWRKRNKKWCVTSRVESPKLQISEWIPYSPPRIRSGCKTKIFILVT